MPLFRRVRRYWLSAERFGKFTSIDRPKLLRLLQFLAKLLDFTLFTGAIRGQKQGLFPAFQLDVPALTQCHSTQPTRFKVTARCAFWTQLNTDAYPFSFASNRDA